MSKQSGVKNSTDNPTKEEIHKELEDLSLKENRHLATDSDKYNIVLIGKTGVGKSATANTIVGERKFREDLTTISVTVSCEKNITNVDDRVMHVVDTPGLANNQKSDDEVDTEIAKFVNLLPGGVHAFIYVMNMASPRFTDEDRNVLRHMEDLFGNDFVNYCLIVFTRRDPEADLQKYIAEEKKRRTKLGSFLESLEGRIIAVDNAATNQSDKDLQRQKIIGIIDEMKKRNNPEVYTGDFFLRPQSDRKRIRIETLLQNWDPSVKAVIHEIIDHNPDISLNSENLEAVVWRKVKEKIDILLALEERMSQVIEVVKKMIREEVQKIRKEFNDAMEDRFSLLETRVAILESQVNAQGAQ